MNSCLGCKAPAYPHIRGCPTLAKDPVKVWSCYGDYRAFSGYGNGLLSDFHGKAARPFPYFSDRMFP